MLPHTIMIFTDGSAQGNPGPTGSGVVIKNPGQHNSPVKLAKAITSWVQAMKVK